MFLVINLSNSCLPYIRSECVIRWWNWIQNLKQTVKAKSGNATVDPNQAIVLLWRRCGIIRKKVSCFRDFSLWIDVFFLLWYLAQRNYTYMKKGINFF